MLRKYIHAITSNIYLFKKVMAMEEKLEFYSPIYL